MSRTLDGPLVVGREGADLPVPGLHARQFRVAPSPTGWVLEDLACRGDTLLNGRSVARAPLRDGDRIRAADVEFQVEVASDPFSRAPTVDLGAPDTPGGASAPWTAGEPGLPLERFQSDLGLFRLVRRLGQGGMGEVYLAEQVKLSRAVVVKFLGLREEDPAQRAAFARRFRQEALILARLDHPNVVKVIDFGETQGRAYLVLEHVPGEDLASVLVRGALGVGEVLDLGIKLADALVHLHAHQVLHRDIKPANVLVSGPAGRRRVRLVDFGIGKILDAAMASGLWSRTGVGMGSFPYIPPEQMRSASSADERSDLYSLGATLHHALSGRMPFQEALGRGRAAVMRAIEEEPPGRPDGAPEGLWEVIGRAMAKDPARRPASAVELLDALERQRP
ncbi:MAG: protein kinase [Planctomycetes bacterium]|nr:protein kinase [Planctomycetota bacterium]